MRALSAVGATFLAMLSCTSDRVPLDASADSGALDSEPVDVLETVNADVDTKPESEVATDAESQDVATATESEISTDAESQDVAGERCQRDEDCPTGDTTYCYVGACLDGACLLHSRPGTCAFVNPGDGVCFNGDCLAGLKYLRGQQVIPAAGACECRRLTRW